MDVCCQNTGPVCFEFSVLVSCNSYCAWQVVETQIECVKCNIIVVAVILCDFIF